VPRFRDQRLPAVQESKITAPAAAPITAVASTLVDEPGRNRQQRRFRKSRRYQVRVRTRVVVGANEDCAHPGGKNLRHDDVQIMRRAFPSAPTCAQYTGCRSCQGFPRRTGIWRNVALARAEPEPGRVCLERPAVGSSSRSTAGRISSEKPNGESRSDLMDAVALPGGFALTRPALDPLSCTPHGRSVGRLRRSGGSGRRRIRCNVIEGAVR